MIPDIAKQISHITLLTTLMCAPTDFANADSLSKNYVEVGNAQLSAEDFFRAVTCGAMPGRECQGSVLKWPAEKAADLKLMVVSEGVPDAVAARFLGEIQAAVDELNSVAPSLRLSLMPASVSRANAHILIVLTGLRAGDVISGTGTALDGVTIEGAAVNVIWDETLHIQASTIVFASDLSMDEEASIVLEEITQALGPIYDILGAYYTDRSIFSENGNSRAQLGDQDRDVLRSLYGGS